MNAQGIEKMVHTIRGIFPSTNISFNNVIEVWQQDQFLLKTSFDSAQKALPLVEKHGKFPSLPELRELIQKVIFKEPEKVECKRCDSTGWDTGQDLMLNANGSWQVVSWGYTQTFKNHEYTYARRCNCGN